MSSSKDAEKQKGLNNTCTNDAEKEGDHPSAENNSNDFVIREGFPALRLPGNKGPWIEGQEPLPRHDVWADEQALTFSDIEKLWQDCLAVFSARTRDDDQAYSAGVTYFLPSQMKPRCALEALVQSIFRKHTDHLEEGVMIPEQSGAEWWTLVLDNEEEAKKDDKEQDDDDEDEDEGDEVGLHFDADYGLEDQAPNLLIHPRLGTVTYMSDFGAPTVVLNKRSPPMDDVEKKTLQGSIRRGWVSHPKMGKHIAFDGRLLHGAPATFFPALMTPEVSEPPTKKAKQDRRRITLLVNVWVNHCPLDAEPLEDEVCEQLKTPWEAEHGKTDDSFKPPFQWNTVHLEKVIEAKKASLSVSSSDPAGEEEVVICNRVVTVKFGASKEDFRKASAAGGLVELELDPDVLSLEVGEEVKSDDEEDENEGE